MIVDEVFVRVCDRRSPHVVGFQHRSIHLPMPHLHGHFGASNVRQNARTPYLWASSGVCLRRTCPPRIEGIETAIRQRRFR